MDTLTTDSTLVTAWIESGDYDYDRQLSTPDYDLQSELWRAILNRLGRWEIELGEWTFAEVAGTLIAVGALCAVLVYLWRNRYRRIAAGEKGNGNVDYTVADDNIYGVDFEKEISRACHDENFAEAVRLIYLRFLRRLSDRHVINWVYGSTPYTYILQAPPGKERQTLQRLTDEYLRVRYGHYPADRAQVEALEKLTEGGEG